VGTGRRGRDSEPAAEVLFLYPERASVAASVTSERYWAGGMPDRVFDR
jgi:hypothetical protein